MNYGRYYAKPMIKLFTLGSLTGNRQFCSSVNSEEKKLTATICIFKIIRTISSYINVYLIPQSCQYYCFKTCYMNIHTHTQTEAHPQTCSTHTHKHSSHLAYTLIDLRIGTNTHCTHRKGGLAMCETQHSFHKVLSHNSKV